MNPDYIDEKGIEYIQASTLATETNRSIDSITEICRRNNLAKIRIKIDNRVVTALPPETVKYITNVYTAMGEKEPKRLKKKDRTAELCVAQCKGCVYVTIDNCCKISTDPFYQWNNANSCIGCWIRRMWERKYGRKNEEA